MTEEEIERELSRDSHGFPILQYPAGMLMPLPRRKWEKVGSSGVVELPQKKEGEMLFGITLIVVGIVATVYLVWQWWTGELL